MTWQAGSSPIRMLMVVADGPRRLRSLTESRARLPLASCSKEGRGADNNREELPLAKSYRNRRGQIVEPTHGRRKGAKSKHARPRPLEVLNKDIYVEVAFNMERLALGVGVFLGKLGHAIPAGEAEEMSQTFIMWLSMCDAPRVEFPLEDETYSVDREGAFRLAVLLGNHAMVVTVLEALAAYEMERGGLDRCAALRAVGEFYKFAHVPQSAAAPNQLVAA